MREMVSLDISQGAIGPLSGLSNSHKTSVYLCLVFRFVYVAADLEKVITWNGLVDGQLVESATPSLMKPI